MDWFLYDSDLRHERVTQLGQFKFPLRGLNKDGLRSFVTGYNPFSTNVQFLYPLKIPENRWFSIFRGYRSGTLVENGFNVPIVCNSMNE